MIGWTSFECRLTGESGPGGFDRQMPIRSRDIDPTLALALKERVRQLISTQAITEPGAARLRTAGMSRWRETLRRNAYHFWAAAACFGGGIAAVPLLADNGPGLTVTALLGMQALAVGFVVRGFGKANQHLTEFVNPEVLRNAGELLALGPAERLYCEGLAALIDAEQTLPEASQGEILAQLNDLLSSFRKLDGPVRLSLATRGNQPIEGLEQELSELVRRREATSDPMARATMDQSIALCSQRLADAAALAPAREQAEAQRELILQALASVHASLSRMATAGSVTVHADVADLQRTVTRVNDQTRAVEDAVNEVITLRG
ncbi:MAG: hypothetical protein K0Q72_2523 [Armatimonadetes bacterium]|nr:hypothetical protein [Armatimonadota bacterium]